jgi:type II secretory ATPase GspE/PulE/Tfp pilus assembly ATPase PilB-like protein
MQHGMQTLRMDGWQKVLAGTTSIDEIAAATKGDRDLVMDRKQ